MSAITPKMAEVTAVAGNEALEGLVCKMPDTELPNPPPLACFKKTVMSKNTGNGPMQASRGSPPGMFFLAAVKKAKSSFDTEVIADVVATQGLQWQRPDGGSHDGPAARPGK